MQLVIDSPSPPKTSDALLFVNGNSKCFTGQKRNKGKAAPFLRVRHVANPSWAGCGAQGDLAKIELRLSRIAVQPAAVAHHNVLGSWAISLLTQDNQVLFKKKTK